jgi:hypothetical protein
VHKICKKESKTFYVQNFSFLENRTFCEVTWNSNLEPDRPQMTIWRTRIACRLRKATNIPSDYAIFIAFPLQIWYTLTRLKVTLFVH